MELRILRKCVGSYHHDVLQFRTRPLLAPEGYPWGEWQDVPVVEE